MALQNTVVELADGTIEGKRGRGLAKGTVSWKGIPFAAPAVGELRWRAPQPVTPWEGVLECHDYGPVPIQDKLFTARGPNTFQPTSEDCLSLNVFAPEAVDDRPRPVMVFNYGGAYILGGTSTPIYDGSFLARARDVIVVTVNYRFGPFGFLDLSGYSTAERTFDSNAGLKDMIAGLEWVQRNIAAFGGDPDRVTVFGESAGGSAVLALLSTPAAEGLFAGAIAQSPAADLVVRKQTAELLADEYVRLLMDPSRRAGAERTEPPLDPAQVAAVVDGASPSQLLKAAHQLLKFTAKAGLSEPMPFAPVVDGQYLPLPPVQAAMEGSTLPVPLITGSNLDEGELFARFWDLLPKPTHYLVGVHDPEIKAEIDRLYPGSKDQVRLSADAVFWVPTMIFAEHHGRRAPVYVYRYDYSPPLLKASGIGATHATELFAVFGMYRHPIGAPLAAAGNWQAAKQVTAAVQSRWTWFARTGVPAEDWPRYSAENRKVLVIDKQPRVHDDPDGPRRAAWERVHLAFMESV
ncbi:carboxylesterase/lipase family protein [Gordonia sp. VNK21]|uniref:carboxylesterase/lipase family protein n=1 Tax=Gordonia sp. VNK21 TaxID=3382483 RepID=UPI0038D42231